MLTYSLFYLVEPAPSYTFVKPLMKKVEGYTKHEVILECGVSSSMAKVVWKKGDKKLEVRSIYFEDSDDCLLHI